MRSHLDTVRSRLMPNAQYPQVRQLLSVAAPKLELHLQEARQSYASLRQSPRG